jgi:hypothetical protein
MKEDTEVAWEEVLEAGTQLVCAQGCQRRQQQSNNDQESNFYHIDSSLLT